LLVISQCAEPLSTVHGGGGGGGVAGGGGGAVGGGVTNGNDGGRAGGGGPTPHTTLTMATAASPDQLEPRVYSKLKLGEYKATAALCQLLPWLPLRLHLLVPAASTTLSVPIVAPYMW
jgi:hypothetical protein